jgi:hypothetical protein
MRLLRLTISERQLSSPPLLGVVAGAPRPAPGDLLEQFAGVVGLGQVGEDAARRGLDRIGNGAVRGEQDHRQRRMALADLVEQRQAVAPGQAHVAQHQLRMFDLELGQRRFGRGHGRDLVAGGVQPHRQQAQHVGVVVDHQKAGAGCSGLGASLAEVGFGAAQGGRACAGSARAGTREAALDGAQGLDAVVQLVDAALAVAQLLGLLVAVVLDACAARG